MEEEDYDGGWFILVCVGILLSVMLFSGCASTQLKEQKRNAQWEQILYNLGWNNGYTACIKECKKN